MARLYIIVAAFLAMAGVACGISPEAGAELSSQAEQGMQYIKELQERVGFGFQLLKDRKDIYHKLACLLGIGYLVHKIASHNPAYCLWHYEQINPVSVAAGLFFGWLCYENVKDLLENKRESENNRLRCLQIEDEIKNIEKMMQLNPEFMHMLEATQAQEKAS